MKKFIVAIACFVLTACLLPGARMYDYRDVVLEIRGGAVQRIVGVATDGNGNGRVLESSSRISYNSVPFDVTTGDIIVTYLVFDPAGEGVDEITERTDYKYGGK